MKKIYISLVVVLVIAIVGLFLPISKVIETTKSLGGSTASDWNVGGNLAVTGNSTHTGTNTLTGTTTAGVLITGSLQQGGSVDSITTSSATYALAATDICSYGSIQFTPSSAATTVTLPATSTLFASCLTTVGQSLDFYYMSVGTSTVIAAGTGGTLKYSSTSTVAAGKDAIINIYRDATNTYRLGVVNLPN